MAKEEHEAVTNFRNYIRIKSVQPGCDYDGCIKWIKEQGEQIGAKMQVVECAPENPAVILTIEGKDPSLPSILLNSHMDVVPVFPEHWKYDPFSGHKDEEGNIYGRGTQDMKCVGVQYLEALKRLLKEGRSFLRTIHVLFVPDEEDGGVNGMAKLVHMDAFKQLNVGFTLDEGLASEGDIYNVYYGQRYSCEIWVTIPGQPGHGSLFIPNTAAEKLRRLLNAVLAFRESEEKKLADNPSFELGDVTTLNITRIQGGVQHNVVPAEIKVGVDIRVPPKVRLEDIKETINKWCKQAGEDVTYDFLYKVVVTPNVNNGEATVATPTDDSYPWWKAFSTACAEVNAAIRPKIFPAVTDLRFLNALGMHGYLFSPMNNTKILLHGHNEYLNEKVFLRGIDIYCSVIPALANVKP